MEPLEYGTLKKAEDLRINMIEQPELEALSSQINEFFNNSDAEQKKM